MPLPTELKQKLNELVDRIPFNQIDFANEIIRFIYNDKTIKIRYNYWIDSEGKRQLTIYLQER